MAALRYLSEAGVFSGLGITPHRAGQTAGDRPAPGAASGSTAPIETILYNGNFLLAVPAESGEAVSAVAIAGGTIVDVGDSTRILGNRSSSTAVVDLGGVTLSPGFVESHAHVISAVQGVYSIDLRYTIYSTYDEVLDAISSAAHSANPGDWLFFMNFDPSLLGWTKGQGFSNLGFTVLDNISTSVNLFVENASGHIAYANSSAFAAATPPVTISSDPGGGGWYGRDGQQLTGVMFEPPSFSPFLRHIPTSEVQNGAVGAMEAFLASAQNQGITTLADPAVGLGGNLHDLLELYNYLASDPNRCVDLVGSLDIADLYTPDGGASTAPTGLTAPTTPGGKGSYQDLIIPNVKMWADGSTQGYTGFLTERYLPPATPAGLGPKGEKDWSQSDMNSLVGQAKADSWSMLIHANGDAGLDMALEALQDVYGEGTPYRNRIEHCTVTRPDQYDTMQRLGVTPSYLNNHIYIWGDTFAKHILGRPRADRLDAAGDAVSHGMIFSFHCDYATSLPGPLRYMQTAVTRETTSGAVLGADQKISALDALKAVTIYPAIQLGLDDSIGTTEVGKYANFVELASDPTAVASSEIASIPIKATWLRGNCIKIP